VKVAVIGLWHLGCVSAAGSAKAGHQVTGLAEDAAAAEALNGGHAPLHEPGLDALIRSELKSGRLAFTADPARALAGAEILWVAFDTPVDAEDRADVDYVLSRVKKVLPLLPKDALLLLSSQLPAGTAAGLKALGLNVACAPENLRLGQALKVFLEPDRVVLGADSDADREKLRALFGPITPNLEFMSAASAEMVKHALNAFLATSVVFINEVAALCETHGADAAEVARGLKSDQRIGPKAYLSPGAAFAGGTLARDLVFLSAQAGAQSFFGAALASNQRHAHWPARTLKSLFPAGLKGKRIALFGLAYKAGTDTLRRSAAVELAEELNAEGAMVLGCDPLVKAAPGIEVLAPADALKGADGLVLFHPWPELDALYAGLNPKPVVVDPQGLFPGGKPQGCPVYVKVGRKA
jgi:UDPglucose 6-dehydrogenase